MTVAAVRQTKSPAQCGPASVRSRRRAGRTAAAVVELALVMPLLCALLLGILEIGQALRVEAVLSKAVLSGCASACRPGGGNNDAIYEVQQALTSANLPATSATVTILVNNVAGNAAAAKRNAKITVTVSLPAASVRILGSSSFSFANSAHSESTTMLKQG